VWLALTTTSNSITLPPPPPPPPPPPLSNLSSPQASKIEAFAMPPHFPTPTKCRLLSTAAYLEDHKVPFFKSDFFQDLHIGKTRGWAILRNGFEQRNPLIKRRSRKPIIYPADL